MWNFGIVQHQSPKDSDGQRKPSSSAPTPPWIPNSALPPLRPDSINSIVRNTLLASPEFPRLYADMVLSTRPNSNEAKILRPKYQKILDRINLMQNTKSCTHIKISGIRCGSPSLRGAQFCYYHQRMHRGVRTPPQARLHPIALIEDKDSIQVALMEVINALLRNTIDMKRATLILRALHIAVKNDARAAYKAQPSNMVKDIPEYDETPGTRASHGLIDLEVPFEAGFGQDPRAARPQRYYKTAEQFEKDRDETIANYYGYPTAEAYATAKENGWTPYSQTQQTTTEAHAEPNAEVCPKPEPTTAHVTRPRRDSLSGCPGGPAVSVRSAVAPSALTPHNFTKPLAPAAQPSQASPSLASNPTNSDAVNAPRKPPMPVKEALATVKKVKGGVPAGR